MRTAIQTCSNGFARSDFAASMPVLRRRGKCAEGIFAAGAAAILMAAACNASAQTSLVYLVVPPSGNLPGVGNDGPATYTLPGYGNVQVSMTNATPALGATYFD